MATKKVKIKKVRNNTIIPQSKNGNWFDCYISKISVVQNIGRLDWNEVNEQSVDKGAVVYKPGDVVVVYLGFATELGEGYEAHLIPRSSTFTNYGLLLTNSMGLIDSTYCGDNDEWKAVFYATRSGVLRVGERVVQMTIEKTNKFDLVEVEHLGNEDRGGYGSTGKQ